MSLKNRTRRENNQKMPHRVFERVCVECGQAGGTVRALKQRITIYVHDQRITPCHKSTSVSPSKGTSS